MKIENHVVTPVSILERGEKYRKFWVSGWAFGTLCICAMAYMGGLVKAHHDDMQEIKKTKDEMTRLIGNMNGYLEKFTTAAAAQEEHTKLVIQWAEYIKSRDEMSNYNRKNHPDPFAGVAGGK